MAAIASATTSVPVFSERPSSRNPNGSATSARAATSNGRYSEVTPAVIQFSRYVRGEARGELAEAPKQQNNRPIPRRRRAKNEGDAAHHTHQQGSDYDAPET